MPKISVIIPIYNVEATLKKCVESVLAQTETDFELLLVNDGSTDRSGAICRGFCDARIRYFEKPNSGLSGARNYGLERAVGDYLVCVDSDDYIEQGCLAYLSAEIERTGADVVLCGYRTENNGRSAEISAAPRKLSGESFGKDLAELKAKNLIDPAWNKIYRLSFLRQHKMCFAEGELYEDTDFNLRLLAHHPCIVVSDRCFYHYVLHSGSITRRYNPEKLPTLKRRANLLRQVSTGIDGYCYYYYVKCVFSALMDMFLYFPPKQVRAAVRREITEPDFCAAARNAHESGLAANLILLAARSKSAGICYAFCRVSYFLKYKMQKLFLKVRP